MTVLINPFVLGESVALPPTITETNIDTPAAAYVQFNADGSYAAPDGNPVGAWCNPVGGSYGAKYQFRYTPISGSLSSGNINTWEAPPVGYERTRAISGTSTASGTVEIRRVSDSVVVATTTLTLNAQVP